MGQPDLGAGRCGGGDFNPVLQGILPVLQWGLTERFQASLLAGHRERSAEDFERAVRRFVKAGVGHRLSRLVLALPPDARDRLVHAPETARRLLHGEATDLLFFLRAALAEHRRLGWPSGGEEAVWSAPGDAWFPLGFPGPLRPSTGDPASWRDDAPYVAPRLPEGIVLDVASPAARARFFDILPGQLRPYTGAEARALLGKLSAAVEVIESACPAAARLFRRFVAVIVARRDDSAPGSFANFSSADQPGRITVVNAHRDSVTAAALADRLVHEAIHSFLYIVEETHTFTPDRSVIDAVRTISPWTGNTLGLHSFVHACLVWFGLWKFWERAAGACALPADEAAALLEAARKGFRDPSLPGRIDRVLPFVSSDARALFTPWIRDVCGGKYG